MLRLGYTHMLRLGRRLLLHSVARQFDGPIVALLFDSTAENVNTN